MNRSRLLSLAVVALTTLTVAIARPTLAQTRYKVTDLGTLPGKESSFCWQQSINDKGEIAVYANNAGDPNAFFTDEPFVWKNGTITPLPGLPDATSTIISSLNNRGQGVGYSRQDPGGYLHGLLWDNGVLIQLPELPGDTRGNTYTLNDRGQVVGFTRHPDPLLPFQIRHATVWDKVGHSYVVIRLPGLTTGYTGDGYDQATGINNEGEVCGESGPYAGAEHAVLWDRHGIHDLGTLGGPTSDAWSINNDAEVVGMSDTADGVTAPFFWRKGKMIRLGMPAGDVFGVAQCINSEGESVGFSLSDPNDFTTSHALLWTKGKMTDLQTRIPSHSGWILLQACGINKRGLISGFGIHNGQFRACLLTPKDDDDYHGHDDHHGRDD